ncbi:MAG: hypothetical protein DMF99_13405 [Acidobacteria bacterium]|nr:MAG: hypothetical protein DMF99_13405 [Acidobacteriota bacterium]
MANDAPATRVESAGFDDLIPIARRLNTASDDLNAALKRIEGRLNDLGIGIDRFVPIPDKARFAASLASSADKPLRPILVFEQAKM